LCDIYELYFATAGSQTYYSLTDKLLESFIWPVDRFPFPVKVSSVLLKNEELIVLESVAIGIPTAGSGPVKAEFAACCVDASCYLECPNFGSYRISGGYCQ